MAMLKATSFDVEEVESALDVVSDILNQTENDREKIVTPLMKAIQEDITGVPLLETNLEERDEEGNTAVIWAVKKNKPQHLKLLMNKEACPNVKTNEGVYAIHKAVDTGNDELVNILCQCGANVNVRDNNGQTALHYAVYYGSIPILMTLLKYHVNVNIADFKGKTALFIAVWKGNSEFLQAV